jgi:hypothetical protein
MNIEACKKLAENKKIDVITKIERLTDENMVIESCILGAKYLKHKKLESIFKGIKKIQYAEGSLPYLLKEYRYAKMQELWNAAKEILGKEEGERFHGAY